MLFDCAKGERGRNERDVTREQRDRERDAKRKRGERDRERGREIATHRET